MEKKQSLPTVYVDRLPIEEATALFNLTVEVALPVRTQIGETGDAALTELIINATALRAQTNRSQKSQLTEQITAERKECADVFKEIKKAVTFESSSRDELRKKSAIDLDFFFKPNKDIMRSPIGNQIDQTVKMILHYRNNPDLQIAAQTISITLLMNELEAKNVALSTTFKTRELENGKQGPSGSDLRPAATDSFIRFSNIIEQAVNYTPNPALLELFIKMSELRKRYHALIPQKKDKVTTSNA